MTDFERRVIFEPGYNYLHETGPRRRGQHGMGIRFLLIGPLGATQFLMSTHWTPLGAVDEVAPGREPCHIDYWHQSRTPFGVHHFGTVSAPSGVDVGHHWWTPTYSDACSYDCEYSPSGKCFYDGSGLAADPVLESFIAEGEAAVWRELQERYESLASEPVEVTP